MDEEDGEMGSRQREGHILVLVARWNLVHLRKRKKLGTAGGHYWKETGERWGQGGNQGPHYPVPLEPCRGKKLHSNSKREHPKGFKEGRGISSLHTER